MSEEQELKKGSTPILILAVLAEGPRHGYAIAREIERRSREALSVGEGALYPALRGLEAEGFIEGLWEEIGSGPARKRYSLTPDGARELQKRTQSWRKYVQAVNRVMGGLTDAEPA